MRKSVTLHLRHQCALRAGGERLKFASPREGLASCVRLMVWPLGEPSMFLVLMISIAHIRQPSNKSTNSSAAQVKK